MIPNVPILAAVDDSGRVMISTRETAMKTAHLRRTPYAALCAQFGAPTDAEWSAYAPGEPKAAVC